mmetsp:Transcript_77367/g.201396  ORF Transcript_77367/g.201396 Transcript_77367/m.201396 type:complete len:259 (+) Transcript_77367:126-902(+)
MCLEDFQRLIDQLAKVLAFALAVVHDVSGAGRRRLEDVEHRQDLSVVWHQGLPDHLGRLNKHLENLEGSQHHLWVPGVECLFDRDDQLRHHWQNLAAALLQHVVHALNRKKTVRILLFPKPIKEDGEVVVVIQLVDLHLPSDPVLRRSVLDLYRQISTVVESPELRGLDGAPLEGPRLRGPYFGPLLSRGCRVGLPSVACLLVPVAPVTCHRRPIAKSTSRCQAASRWLHPLSGCQTRSSRHAWRCHQCCGAADPHGG